MMRLADLVLVLTPVLALLGSGPSWAAEEGFPFAPSDEMRGMLVLKLPFGGSETFATPRLGLDFHLRRRSDLDRLENSYDPKTGRRLPELDAGSMRTWSLDRPDIILPDESRDELEAVKPGSARLPRG